MPWSSFSDVPENLKHLDGVALTLSQANSIARQADAIGGDYGWPTAIKIFKKSHVIHGSAWVNREASEKEADDILINKMQDGSYWITAISTAAVEDQEGETFDVEAIDYDMKEAKANGDYPEFRVFHSPLLGIGQVEKMSRVGIFAVDEGRSYTDAFSLAVCKEWLNTNNGKWRVSRGFRVQEATGDCPRCRSTVQVSLKHMIAGFSCPVCKAVHPTYKGTLKQLHYKKCRTFDVTVTDVPCVPVTGVAASQIMEVTMKKEELRKRLLEAGLAEAVVDERLKSVDEARLKELGDDLPDAVLLKEFTPAPVQKDAPAEEPGTFILDPDVLEDFRAIVAETVKKEVAEALAGMSLEITDVQVKELPELQALKELIQGVAEKIDQLLQADEDRLKEVIQAAPRAAKLRIIRNKELPKKVAAAADDEEEDDEEEVKEMAVIKGADGKKAKSMTEFITGGE